MMGCDSTPPFLVEVGILLAIGFLLTEYTLAQYSILTVRLSFALREIPTIR